MILLTRESPYPAYGSARLRNLHVLKLLAEHGSKLGQPEVLCFGGAPAPREDLPPVRIVQRERIPIWRQAASSVLQGGPESLAPVSQAMLKALRERASPGRLLWVSGFDMARYVPLARAMGYRIVFDQLHVESIVLLRRALSSPRRWPGTLLAAQCAYYEETFCNASDLVVATSEMDAARLRKIAPEAVIHVLPSTIDVEDYAPYRSQEGSTLLFSGALDDTSNLDGLAWFVSEIHPRLKATLGRELPRIVLAGKDPSRAWTQKMEARGIEVRPNPPSMAPLIGEAAVVFIPIRAPGAGRLKILEAMAAGRAVVTTGRAFEGLVLSPTYDVFVADRADSFASAMARVIREPALREGLGRNAIRTIESGYDWRCVRDRMATILDTVSRKPLEPRR